MCVFVFYCCCCVVVRVFRASRPRGVGCARAKERKITHPPPYPKTHARTQQQQQQPQTDIFLRELISNAADALDKLRLASLTDKAALEGGPEELDIRLSVDPDARVLEIRDTGVGMTREELVSNLGTIAKSGTSAFLDALAKTGSEGKAGAAVDGGKKAKKSATGTTSDPSPSSASSLIGQFGVGFYSAYLVADRVQVVSAPVKGASGATPPKQWVWESAADGAFEVYEDSPASPRLGRGTAVRLFLKPDKPEYADHAKLRALVARYSEFVGHPILLNASRTVEEPVVDEDEDGKKKEKKNAGDDATTAIIEDEEDDGDADTAPKPKTKTVTVYGWERLNDVAPVWLRPPAEVTEADHASFYSALVKAGPSAPPPLTHAHFKAEGDVEFRAILYVPPSPPPAFYENYYSADPAVRLYVRRVFVGDDFGKELLPRYLGFLAGVVDSDSLPLSVSRETLQAAPALRTIKKKLVRKALDALKRLADAEEEEVAGKKKKGGGGLFGKKKDEDSNTSPLPYTSFWRGFGKAVKLGIMEDAPNRARLARLLRFETSAAGVGPPGAPNTTSLAGYVSRMKPGQKAIFYLTGGDRETLERSPFARRLAAAGVEALYFTDAIDEYLAQHLTDFDGTRLQSASKEGLALGDEDGGDAHKAKAVRAAFRPLADWWKAQLGPGAVSSVRVVPAGLGTAPAVVTTSAYGWSAHMERVIKAQALAGSEGAARAAYMRGQKILEINPRHALIQALRTAHASDPAGPATAALARLLWDAALLESGFDVEDPAAFAARLHAAAGRAYGGLDSDAAAGELSEPDVPALPVEEEEGGEDDEDEGASAPAAASSSSSSSKKAAGAGGKKKAKGAVGVSLEGDGGDGKDEL
jgi:heat shock protein 90kDa beta